ncbi:MAG: hypothetical protein EBX51_02260, partial [Acidimicrobiia bacterium]|nr:hypothetical protein [Acidimicrobiia bacterium]
MSSFVARVDRIDERLDGWFEPLRNVRPLVYLFNTASAVGDFGAIWHVIGVVGALTGSLSWSQAVVLAALMGAESLLLNQGIKRLLKDCALRQRDCHRAPCGDGVRHVIAARRGVGPL